MSGSMKFCYHNPEDSNTVHEENAATAFDAVVNIMVSYDMGWTIRGCGRDYDNLNGFGSIVGVLSRQILDYSTCNRKCKKCDMGRTPLDHNCRLNYWDSSKAMEAHVANKHVNNSSILKSNNLQVGIFVGDDDSSSISACRAGSSHPIGKLSDTNHTSNGIKRQLYDIEKTHNELTKNDNVFTSMLYICHVST
ncbi:uncharacterized protein LOC113463857 [Ceratina calcarata]|uniref:Uncharacterized protein LOC113463857 n=1 Tax=Ceratina calcarata TaxID=156304 RepID=A0AAJ7W829_9HYME|nr:uncharacterized protein LOC113463857 [Ceratina calcarata]